MNEIAKRWVEYLKTNPKKAKERLVRFDENGEECGRCCLGHALKILKKEKEYDLKTASALRKIEFKKLGLNDNIGSASARLKCPDTNKPFFTGVEPVLSLAQLNDSTDCSHRYIARVIEHNKDALFNE